MDFSADGFGVEDVGLIDTPGSAAVVGPEGDEQLAAKRATQDAIPEIRAGRAFLDIQPCVPRKRFTPMATGGAGAVYGEPLRDNAARKAR
ncbi:hypothetical protein GCM10010439_71860 [Actinocorallia aurantiaca]|uniref:Uncharacterized protein n=1 Tax=Actinocorallia aurantiaca TaxID=46204 RepID=A0ABN3UXN6_9ACTN